VPRPLAVALTGGIAAGKSETLASFARHGAATASSDAIVHELLAHDDEVRDAIRERFGDDAVGDRRRIGEIVFGDPAELDWLEQLLHPRVVRAQRAWFEELEGRSEPPGGEQRFDAVVVVTASREVREKRRGDFAEREARLVPDEEKARHADFAYVNEGSLDDLDAFVASVVERLSSF
jgi:dephospho-CoA kinase